MEQGYGPYGKSNLSKIQSKILLLTVRHPQEVLNHQYLHTDISPSIKVQQYPGSQFFAFSAWTHLSVLFTIWVLHVKIHSHCKSNYSDFLACFHWQQKAMFPMPTKEPSMCISSLFFCITVQSSRHDPFPFKSSGGRLRKLYLHLLLKGSALQRIKHTREEKRLLYQTVLHTCKLICLQGEIACRQD